MLTPTTSTPPSISPEAHAELTSRTPASFSDIPPILRWEDEAQVQLTSPGWTHWPMPNGEAHGEVNGEVPSVLVKGRLYVTEAAVTFLPEQLTGWTLPFPALTLHALTPAGESPAHIYCQIDESNPAEEEEEYAALSEMRIFVASDKLESLFSALSACSALHDSLLPSGEPTSFFGFEDDDDAFEDADEDEDEGTGAGREDPPDQDMSDGNIVRGEDPEIDAISTFLAKVNWSVPPPGTWVDDSPTPRSELESARSRVAYLETLLREERARVRLLEEQVGVLEGRFDDQ